MTYTEIEAKLKVDSHGLIEKRLAALDAEFVAEQLQKDYFFDDDENNFAESDSCLRLRRQVSEKKEKVYLTYKGPKEKSNLKKRQEIEIEVSSAELAEKLLLAIGYARRLVIEKRRQLWHLGRCFVSLDTLPLLGNFIEIEGPDEKEIADVQKKLGLTDLPHIAKSYSSLIKDKLTATGDSRIEICLYGAE